MVLEGSCSLVVLFDSVAVSIGVGSTIGGAGVGDESNLNRASIGYMCSIERFAVFTDRAVSVMLPVENSFSVDRSSSIWFLIRFLLVYITLIFVSFRNVNFCES